MLVLTMEPNDKIFFNRGEFIQAGFHEEKQCVRYKNVVTHVGNKLVLDGLGTIYLKNETGQFKAVFDFPKNIKIAREGAKER